MKKQVLSDGEGMLQTLLLIVKQACSEKMTERSILI